MTISRNYSPRLLLGVIFLLMLALAAVIEITGSDIAQRILVILIPLGGVFLGVVSTIEADSKIEAVFGTTLVLSGFAATILGVVSGNPFSNRLVDIASIAGTSLSQPIRSTVQAAQRLVAG